MNTRPLLPKLLAAVSGLLLACALHAETWRFAVIGDTPYNDHEVAQLPRLLDEIAAQHPAFIVHAGDFKDSRMVCSDQTFRARRDLLDASPLPLIYVPGDNEWTDCRQLVAGNFDPLERLQKLRELFFAEPRSLGRSRLSVEQQPGSHPEHLRWQLGPLLFVSLNVPGPNNNYGMENTPSDEFLVRNRSVVDWLRQAFARARHGQLAGVVIVMQANPSFKHHAAGLTHAGFRELLDTLTAETIAFPGQVLLIHGDTHWQRIDQPLRHPTTRQPLTNFTRLETFGYPFMGWVKVIVDDQQPQLFRFEVHPYSAARP